MVQFGVPTVEAAMKLGREAAECISGTFIKVSYPIFMVIWCKKRVIIYFFVIYWFQYSMISWWIYYLGFVIIILVGDLYFVGILISLISL